MTTAEFLALLSIRMTALPTGELVPILERVALELAARGKFDAVNYVSKARSCLIVDPLVEAYIAAQPRGQF